MNLEKLGQTHVMTSIYDIKSEIYLGVNLARSSADFIRSVQVEAKNPNSMLHKFPSDYELHIIAYWDEASGVIGTDVKRLGSVLDLCPLS